MKAIIYFVSSVSKSGTWKPFISLLRVASQRSPPEQGMTSYEVQSIYGVRYRYIEHRLSLHTQSAGYYPEPTSVGMGTHAPTPYIRGSWHWRDTDRLNLMSVE